MADGIEIQPRLRRRNAFLRVLLHADVLDPGVFEPYFYQDALQNLPVSLRKPFAEQPGGYAHDDAPLFGSLKPRGSKPGVKTMWVYPALHMMQDPIPLIHTNANPSGHSHFCGNDVEIPHQYFAGADSSARLCGSDIKSLSMQRSG